jgi:hypothetical protein
MSERERSGATEQDCKGESFAMKRRKYLALSEVREDKVTAPVGTVVMGSKQ